MATKQPLNANTTTLGNSIESSEITSVAGTKVTPASTSVRGTSQLSNSYSGTSQSKAVTEKALSDGLSNKMNIPGQNESTAMTAIKAFIKLDSTHVRTHWRHAESSIATSGSFNFTPSVSCVTVSGRNHFLKRFTFTTPLSNTNYIVLTNLGSHSKYNNRIDFFHDTGSYDSGMRCIFNNNSMIRSGYLIVIGN